jgi:hypothetical protein
LIPDDLLEPRRWTLESFQRYALTLLSERHLDFGQSDAVDLMRAIDSGRSVFQTEVAASPDLTLEFSVLIALCQFHMTSPEQSAVSAIRQTALAAELRARPSTLVEVTRTLLANQFELAGLLEPARVLHLARISTFGNEPELLVMFGQVFGSALQDLARVTFKSGDRINAAEVQAKAVEVLGMVYGSDSDEFAAARLALSRYRFDRGEFDSTMALIEAAPPAKARKLAYGLVRQLERDLGEHAPPTRLARTILITKIAELAEEIGRDDPMHAELRQDELAHIEILRRTDAESTTPFGGADEMASLAGFVQGWEDGAHGSAIQHARENVEAVRAAYGPGSPELAAALDRLSSVLLIAHQRIEAEQVAAEAADCAGAAFGPDDPRTLKARLDHGEAMVAAEMPQEAIVLFRGLLPDQVRLLGRDHEQTRASRRWLMGLQ